MSNWGEIYGRIAQLNDFTEDEAEHYKRIKEMPNNFEVPEHVRKMCEELKKKSECLFRLRSINNDI